MNKKIKAMLLIILLSIIFLIGTSFAYWQFSETQKEISVVGTKCFKLTMLNESAGIQIDKAIPSSDEEGMESDGYTFTIKNVCNTNAAYQINLEELELEEKRLPNDYIRVSLNESKGKNLNTYEKVKETIEGADTSHKLTSGSLKPDEEVTYNLKLWLDENTPASEEVISSTFKSKVSIIATYKEDLTNEIEIIVESETKEYSKEEEKILIKATSSNYNFIEVSEDGVIFNPIEKTKEYQTTKTYQKEGIYKIYLKDEMGNIKEQEIETTKLDQTPPEITVKEETPNENGVQLKINIKDIKSGLQEYQITETRETPTIWEEITGHEEEIEKEVTENKMYYIWGKDKVGNIKTLAYNVTKVDKNPPTLEVTNSLTNWGLKDKIIIKANDDYAGISGYNISKIETEYSWTPVENNPLEYQTEIEVEENGVYYVSVKDAYDHITTKPITIEWIDKEGPNIKSINPSTNYNATNEITIEAEDKAKIEGYNITKEDNPPNEWIPVTKTEEENMATKYEYGTSWGRVFYHNSKGATNLFQNEEEVLTSNNENKYSVLKKIENYQTKEKKYEFLLEYPTLSKTKYNRWIQSANPTTTTIANGTGSETAPGYEEVHIDWSGNYWGGLTKSTNQSTFINGSVGHGNWFYAIGSYSKYNGGIPGPVSSAVTSVELWAKIEDIERERKEQIKVKIGGIKENGTYYVWVKDTLGNQSKRTVIVNKKDETGPNIKSLTTDTAWKTSNTITAKVEDKESGLVGISWSTTSTPPENFTEVGITNAEQTFTNVVTENKTYYFHAKDNAGNITTKSVVVNRVDKTPPTITNVTGNPTAWTKNNVTLTINGATDDGIGLHEQSYSFDNGISWQTENTKTYTMNTNNIIIKVRDALGNTYTNPAISITKIDKTNPTQSFGIASQTGGSNGWYKALAIKVTGSDGQSGIASAKYCTTTSSTCTPGTNGTLSNNAFNVTLGNNASAQKVCANFTDKVGNTSATTCSGTFKVDTTDPTAKITATAKQNNITISANGSSDNGSGIATYYYSKDDGATWQSSTSNSYTYTNLSVTTYKLAVKVTDKSGRTSAVVKASATIASDVTIFDSGSAKYTYQLSYSGGQAPRISGTYFYFDDGYNKTVMFKTAFNNNYKYLKVSAKATKSSVHGSYHVARFGIKTDLNAPEGIPSNCIKNNYIIGSASSSNVTTYKTFSLDLGAVTQNSYYVYLHNCDTFYYVKKVWLSNTA